MVVLIPTAGQIITIKWFLNPEGWSLKLCPSSLFANMKVERTKMLLGRDSFFRTEAGVISFVYFLTGISRLLYTDKKAHRHG